MSILRYGTLVNYLLCVHFILFECGAFGGISKTYTPGITSSWELNLKEYAGAQNENNNYSYNL